MKPTPKAQRRQAHRVSPATPHPYEVMPLRHYPPEGLLEQLEGLDGWDIARWILIHLDETNDDVQGLRAICRKAIRRFDRQQKAKSANDNGRRSRA